MLQYIKLKIQKVEVQFYTTVKVFTKIYFYTYNPSS